MNPTHKVIITPAMLGNYFAPIIKAYRNPNGAFCELKIDEIIQKAHKLGRDNPFPENFDNPVYLISSASDDMKPYDLYLTILD